MAYPAPNQNLAKGSPGAAYRQGLLAEIQDASCVEDDDNATPAQRMAAQHERTLAEDLYREACD